MLSGSCSPWTWETWVWVSLLIPSLKLWYWGIQAAWSGSASSDRTCLLAMCICDLACLHPACPGKKQGTCTSNPVCLHFSRACGCVGISPKHHLWIWKQWSPSGAQGQPQQGRAGCREMVLLAAGPVAHSWCVSLKKSHGFMTGMKTNPSMKILSPERIFPRIPPQVAALRPAWCGGWCEGVSPAAPYQHLD